MPPTVVLLGFDGVLADAENVHVVAWQRVLVRLGWEVPDAVAGRAAAMDDRAFAAEVFAARGIDDADLDGWVAAKRELASRMFGMGPRAFPGAVALVRALAGRGVRPAIVADDRRENIDAFLAATGLADAVELVVAAGDDAHRLALDRLGADPAVAVAAEGSAERLAAARAAGVAAVAVGHRREAGEWSAGAAYVPALEPLADALDALGLADRSA